MTTSGRGDCLETTMAVLQEVCIAAANASSEIRTGECFPLKEYQVNSTESSDCLWDEYHLQTGSAGGSVYNKLALLVRYL